MPEKSPKYSLGFSAAEWMILTGTGWLWIVMVAVVDIVVGTPAEIIAVPIAIAAISLLVAGFLANRRNVKVFLLGSDFSFDSDHLKTRKIVRWFVLVGYLLACAMTFGQAYSILSIFPNIAAATVNAFVIGYLLLLAFVIRRVLFASAKV